MKLFKKHLDQTFKLIQLSYNLSFTNLTYFNLYSKMIQILQIISFSENQVIILKFDKIITIQNLQIISLSYNLVVILNFDYYLLIKTCIIILIT